MNNSKNNELINVLNNCALACNYCTTACLEEDDVRMMRDCIKLDIDCAAICSLTANFIARNSIHGKHLLNECAELCRLCGTECARHTKMQHCQDCAAACRSCEAACRAAA